MRALSENIITQSDANDGARCDSCRTQDINIIRSLSGNYCQINTACSNINSRVVDISYILTAGGPEIPCIHQWEYPLQKAEYVVR